MKKSDAKADLGRSKHLNPSLSGRGKTVDKIVEHMRRGILSGMFAPGQRLIEADITRELGVSRGPVREAFRQLSADGMVEMVSNRGTLVRRLSYREVVEFYEIRTALELLAAANAAANITVADNRAVLLALIDRLLADHQAYSRDDFFEENTIFHETIADLSGNQQLAGLIRQMQMPLILFRLNRNLSSKISIKAVTEHLAIAHAILEGDIQGAEATMRAHLQNGLQRLPVKNEDSAAHRESGLQRS